jgi:hypothetical protein
MEINKNRPTLSIETLNRPGQGCKNGDKLVIKNHHWVYPDSPYFFLSFSCFLQGEQIGAQIDVFIFQGKFGPNFVPVGGDGV